MTQGNRNENFFVVGIGASAGGLEALELFFDNLPRRANLAYVIVQHLSPDYKSLMGELLGKHTQMPIYEAEDGVRIQPDTVYLIPRRKNMTVFSGRLFLTEQPKGLNLPIDLFFESLADDFGERAIGIVLSGTGSDGTRGLRAIKEAGGITMAQDAESAKFDGMPRSAAATGIVDFTHPPERIASELTTFTSGSVALAPDDGAGEISDGSMLSKIFMLIKRQAGVDLSSYKESTIIRRIERRMGINQVHDIYSYVQMLEESPEEVQTLFKEILIGVTRFFRDPEAFEQLRVEVLPELLRGKGPNDPLRIWVPGCSTGEEAYSIAILLAEYMGENDRQVPVKIFATDIDKDAVEFASYGTYPESIAADASLDRLGKYFVKKGENYQVAQSVREMVIFAYHNIFKDPPFRRVDLVSCRNLLIYLQPSLQKQVISNFMFSLADGGYLLLGTSETIGEHSVYFSNVDIRWKIFHYKGGGQPERPHIAQKELGTGGVRPQVRTPLSGGRSIVDDKRLNAGAPASSSVTSAAAALGSDRIWSNLIEGFLPPGVLVDENRTVLHIFGDTSEFMKLPAGRLDFNISRMAREELSVPLGTALQNAVDENKEVAYSGIHLPGSDGATSMQLRVKPLGIGEGRAVYAVLFEKEEDGDTEEHEATPFRLDEAVKRRISDLESDLQYTRENLQATIEELETSNEELQATNEELVSSNEELQSTNEELQSVNEELITVNSEYQKKIEELSELNSDMNNLLASTDIGTVFLDHDLRVRKFTPPVTKQVNLIKSDIGRPLSDISHNLMYEQLEDDILEVLRSQVPREIEVQSKLDTWLLLKVQPYRTSEDQVGGVVVTLVDITRRKQSEHELQQQQELMMRVLESNPTAITMVDHTGSIIFANKRAEELLGLSRDELGLMTFDDSQFRITGLDGNPIPSDELPFAQVLARRQPVAGFVHRIVRPDHKDVTICVTGNPIYDHDGEVDGAVFNIREIDDSEGLEQE